MCGYVWDYEDADEDEAHDYFHDDGGDCGVEIGGDYYDHLCDDCLCENMSYCEYCDESSTDQDDQVWCCDTQLNWEHTECMRQFHKDQIVYNPELLLGGSCRDCEWTEAPQYIEPKVKPLVTI